MKKLYRSKKNKVLGGVLGGLAEYFELDPVLPRIIFLVAFIFVKHVTGFLVLAYIISCIILPYRSKLSENGEGSAREISSSDNFKNSQKILAWSFIFIGAISLLIIAKPFPFLQSLNSFTWPILLVLLGLLVLIVSIPKK
jgi:phage shock protein C